jgi:Flp pilus assembly protein TadG
VRIRTIGLPAGWFSVAQPSGCALELFADAMPAQAESRTAGSVEIGVCGKRPGKGTRNQRGVELLEFALVLPVLLILLVGIFDFGTAFALRQKMTNAAREAARIVVSSPLTNQNCLSTTPCSIVAAVNAMAAYMNGAGASLSCVQPASPTTSSALEWTYTCPDGTEIVINRAYTVSASGGALLPATRVTFVYPFTWRLASFLPGYSGGSKLSTEVTMANLVN